jgi:hypothetical protein
MTRLGFQFRGLGEDSTTTTTTTTATTDTTALSPSPFQPLPLEWNQVPDSYAFRYTHDQSSFTFLLKALKIAGKLMIHGLAIEDGKLHTLELSIKDYIPESSTSESIFPVKASSLPLTQQHQGEGASADWFQSHPLGGGGSHVVFGSQRQLEELLYQFKTRIIDHIMPNINKPGYEPVQLSSSNSSSSSASTQQQQQPAYPRHPLHDPLFDGGRGAGGPFIYPAGAGGIGGIGGVIGGRNPYSIGDVDLDPFAAAPGILPPRYKV